MIMTAADQARFPRATRYLRRVLPTVINIPVIVRAMRIHGQLDRAAFRNALMWGTQPTISIVAGLPVCGRFIGVPGNNTILIAEDIFTDFEAGRGQLRAAAGNVPALGVNVLHEMVHWGDNADGVHAAADAGDAFEMLVYRRNLGC